MTTTKREGKIYKNGEYYFGEIYLGLDENGKKKVKKFKGKRKKDVQERIDNYLILINNGASYANEFKLENYISNWFEKVKAPSIKVGSASSARNTINNHIIPRLGKYKLVELTPMVIQEYLINDLSQKYSFSTIKKAHCYLNACLDYAIINDILNKNPCKAVTLPNSKKDEVKPPRFLTSEEVKRFIEALNTKTKKNNKKVLLYKNKDILLLCLFTGARIGEIIGLKWKYVDMEKEIITIAENRIYIKDKDGNQTVLQQKSTKTGKTRIIPFNTGIKEIIERYRLNYTGDDETYVVTSTDTTPTYNSLKTTYKRACDRAEIKNCNAIHTLRHTFASYAFLSGNSSKDVSEILGHSDTIITNKTYIHLIEDQKREVMNSIQF